MSRQPESKPQCQWKIRWTFDTDAQCELPHHIDGVAIKHHPNGQFDVFTTGEGPPDHYAHVGPHNTKMNWAAGDRREFTGEWPGPCTTTGCTLHTGHHGRCAI